jgi:hypothetical protein
MSWRLAMARTSSWSAAPVPHGSSAKPELSGLNSSLAAALELLRNEFCRDDQDREIGMGRQVGDGAVGFETLDLGLAAAHRVDRSGERLAFHDLQDASTQPVRIG